MVNRYDSHRLISSLTEGQLFAVLATQQGGQPYTSLVSFAASNDLGSLFFATGRTTAKFKNIQRDNRVALLIDDRSNASIDVLDAAAVTVIGAAAVAGGGERDAAGVLLLDRHPQLAQFLRANDTALLKVLVSRYILVTRFQEVVVWEPSSLTPAG